MQIELTCRECGSNHFRLGEAVNDGSLVSCEDCGHLMGTLGELKSRVAAQVIAQSTVTSIEPRPDLIEIVPVV